MSYNSTSITITSEATPDPWVVQANGKYFMTFTAGDRLEIWRANQLDYFRNPEKCIVW
jgi:GH43 family beta-xylosidase